MAFVLVKGETPTAPVQMSTLDLIVNTVGG